MNDIEFNEVKAYELMAQAHDVAKNQSAHPDNKIASVLELTSGDVIASANLWLHAFSPDYDTSVKIGRSSPTKHSEPAAISKAAQQGLSTDGASLYINEPLCPNCMNAIVTAGVKNIYIEEQSFEGEGDWYNRRSYHFDSTSLQIASNAGVKVYKLRSDDENKIASAQLIKLPEPTKNINMDEHFTLETVDLDSLDIKALKSVLRTQFDLHAQAGPKKKMAMATFVIPPKHPGGLTNILSVHDVSLVGREDKNLRLREAMSGLGVDEEKMNKECGKYQAKIFPLDHARSVLGRLGIEITPETQIITTRVPTSHEIVNLCDVADNVQLHVLDHKKTWMREDRNALKLHRQAGASLEIPPAERSLKDIITHDGFECNCG